MIVLKLAALLGICGAIWLTVHFLIVANDQRAGVANPMEDRPSLFKRMFATPEPTPEPAPKFGR